MFVKLFIYFNLFLCLFAQMNLIKLPSTGKSKCLDGSQAAFYHSKGFGEGIDKFVVFFDGQI